MRYHSPVSFEEASVLASGLSGLTRFLGGGTDVLVQLRSGSVCPDDVIDLKRIAGSGDIVGSSAEGWTIGCAVSGARLGAHAALSASWPGVVEGMTLVGSTQVQGRATLVGNLCNGSPAADGVPGLIAAGATATVVGPSGRRVVAVSSIPAGPGRTTLARGEVIAALHLPPRGASAADAYQRFIPRTEMDIAVVGCAVNLRLDGDTIAEARVALGAVAPTVLLVEAAARAIVGSRLDAAALEALAAAARAAARPISDKRGTAAFRTHVAGVLARRVAQSAYNRAKGNRAKGATQ
ncbi:MAG: xanthine dehydrogenase family protein subunit M [Rhodobacteraceae bacterium]|nr:xanthine dehydrogenase family protein subunit M [Paracoccaceae bacterium]